MMVANTGYDLSQKLYRFEDLRPDLRVLLDFIVLFVIESVGFRDDGIRDADLSHVVQKSGEVNAFDERSFELHLASNS